MTNPETKPNKPDNIEVGMDTEVVKTPSTDIAQEKPQQSIEDEIQSRQNKIEQLTGFVETTNTDLQKEREKLGLPPTTEEPPNVLVDRKKIEILISEQESLREQEGKTSEKVEKAFAVEVSKSFIRLSGKIADFEDTLKGNKFNPISFHAEDFMAAAINESVDLGKATQAFADLYTAMRKDFMPSDNRDKLSIEPYNFSRVIESLDELRVVIIGVRKQINERPGENKEAVQELSESMTKLVNTMRRKMDDMEDVRTARKRLGER